MGQRLGDSFRMEEEKTVRVLEELHMTQRSQMETVRQRAGRPVSAAVTVRPAAAGERDQVVAQGSTRELRPIGVLTVLAKPLEVGSCYWLEFDQTALDLPPCFALCDSCALVASGEFQTRFQMLQVVPVPMPAVENAP